MTHGEKKYIKEVVNHFVDMYKLDLKPYYKAYEIWFQQNLISEIVLDFLNRVKIPAKIRITKVKTLQNNEDGTSVRGRIHGLETNNQPILFYSEEFKNKRFLIEIHERCYHDFSVFITTFIHELAHLVLYSTHNKYHKSEVATDLFVMCFGLFFHVKSGGVESYITKEQIAFAQRYIELKRKHIQSSGIHKFLLEIQMKLI